MKTVKFKSMSGITKGRTNVIGEMEDEKADLYVNFKNSDESKKIMKQFNCDFVYWAE